MNKLNFLENLWKWFLTHGIKIISILIAAAVVDWILKIIITKFIKNKIKEKISEERKKKKAATLIGTFYGTINFIIWAVAILMILSELGINITPILASLGIVGLAVGMAAKDIIADFISGIFILLEGQYYIGDEVKIGDIEGKVKEITLRRTILKDKDNMLHFIPNSQIKIVARKAEEAKE